MGDIILLNDLDGGTFYELYAGGAGASLNLLLSNVCSKVVLNDIDYHIYAFWHCVLSCTEQLIKLISDTEVNIENWKIQNEIYRNFDKHNILEVGFSTFFLNRSNRSGILYKAGPIGGREQMGKYKIDVRFNKINLIKRIEKIARLKDKIELHNTESIEILSTIFEDNASNKFIFLDPPYYEQGKHLYLSFYEDADHVTLRNILEDNRTAHWFLTYDNCQRINDLYRGFKRSYVTTSYTLQEKRKSKEVMVFSDSIYLPKQFRIKSKTQKFSVVEPSK
ncbi:MAG: DNA adenine methylase [Deltaproteobacteria bacterium]|nr:DNA adenine methylase [Deltaproteobacteria bacterium]